MEHYNIRVSGRVQGVNFRNSTAAKARELGITGFVRNEPDGSVYIECEGSEENLKKLIEWCHTGPALARVDRVMANPSAIKGFTGFYIDRD